MKAWLIVSLCFLAAADNPGIQLSLTEDTLNTGLFTFYAFYLTSADFFIGDYNYTLKTDLVDLDIKLTNINITSVSLDYAASDITLKSPNVLTYTIQNLEVDATADYDIKAGLIHLSPGEAHVILTRTNATVSVSLSTLDSKPQIKFESVVFTLGDMDINTQLPKEINDLINKELKDKAASLDKLLPSLATENEENLNNLLSSLDLVIACPVEPLAVDLGIILGPNVLGNDTLVIGLNGTVLAGGLAVPALPAVPVSVNSVLTEGLQLAITDFVINSVLAPVWSSLNVTLSSLPASLGMPLDTDTLAMLIPQFRNKYGAGRPMMLTVYTDENSEVVYYTEGNFFVNASANVDFWVNVAEQWENVLTLEMAVSVEIEADISNNVANCNLTSLRLDGAKQLKSAMGNVNTGMMEQLFNDLVSLVLDEVNPLLSNTALNLPDGIGYFVNTDDVKAATGYLIIGAQL